MMLYAILIYGSESALEGWTKAEGEAMTARHYAVRHELEPQQKVGPAFRLMPTTNAVSVRNGAKQVVLDGPYAETKEQLLGLWTVDCENLEEVIAIAKRLTFESAAFEIRPVRAVLPASAG